MLSVCSMAGFSRIPDRHGRPRGGIIAENGRQTPRTVRVPADVWRLSRRPAFWSDTSLWLGKVLPFVSRPVSAPTIPRGESKGKERPEKLQRGPHTCRMVPSYEDGGGTGNSLWKGGGWVLRAGR